MSRLPVVDNVRIASPCDMAWDDMAGDDRRRHCEECNKNVYNLSVMTPEAFVDLVERTEGKFCGRIFKRHDGTVLTKEDCPVGVRRLVWQARRRAVATAAFCVSLVAAGFASLSMRGVPCNSTAAKIQKAAIAIEKQVEPPPIEMLGDVAPDFDMGEVAID